ncbi:MULTISPECIES: hypothetical protein [unclassified Roseburia]|uniref:hypothetical protein n=1 Tax=unclassified Roseburia TaxID=2637578 RepID=UPI000E4E23AD|nr:MULTISPECIES: hypothetical protein [unclassified Roseburia]
MSKSEDYLDDLLNSVSDANRRNNKKDIENLIQSMNEEAAKPREREKKPVEKKHEDYSGTGFLREFEQELSTGAADDFLQEFEMELDEEASNQADIDVNEDQTSDVEEASATSQQEASNQMEEAEQLEENNQLRDASEPVSSGTTDMATDGSAPSDMMEDVDDIMDAVRKKVGDSGEEEHMDTSKTPEDDASEEEEPLGFFDTLDEDSAAEIPEASKTESEEEEPLLSEDDDAINLMDMLSGDADLSDIGDLLKADENGEELEHSEDEDSEVQDEFERLGSIEELKDLKEAKEKRKKQGFFSKIMSVLFGPDEEEDDTKIAEDDSLGSISSENREILKEMDADEGAGKKGKKEKKKKEKKEKKEKAKKEKAPKVKKEKPQKEIDRTPPLPKKPVILIFIMALSLLILILLGSSNLQYGQDMQQAKDDFASGSYVTAFQTVAGSSVKGKDENFYKKAQVLASIQSEYQSYESLSGINENEMALDALIRGYGRCVDGADLAQEYEITDEMAGLKNQILQQLSDHFGVSEEKAAELHAMTKRTDYTKAIQEILAAAGLE